MSNEAFVPYCPWAADGKEETVQHHGVPFRITRNDKGQALSWNHTGSTFCRADVNETCQALFFLGMTTKAPEGSEWWGQNEKYHAFHQRLFLGDRLGRINIDYADGSADFIDIIFGVNVFAYDLVETPQPGETGLNSYWGPFAEPFASDPNAARLLKESLMLTPNNAEKGMRYILAVRTRMPPVKQIHLTTDTARAASFVLSGFTALRAGKASSVMQDPCWRWISRDLMLGKRYLPALDRLARRLYQFRDELPAHSLYDPPAGYVGPKVWFSGTPMAEYFATVYAHNLHDMMTDKLEENGVMHTSSRALPNFGSYVGIGTYKDKAGSYYSHAWSRDVSRSAMEVVDAGERERAVLAGEWAHKCLYGKNARFARPNWKRIMNAHLLEGDANILNFASCKENDGHGSTMLFIYSLFSHGLVDVPWLQSQKQAILDAADWFMWQIRNPAESCFDGLLSSETEASAQNHSMPDLFSNTMAVYALRAYAKLADALGEPALGIEWLGAADLLWKELQNRFVLNHPRHGKVFVDPLHDCWTMEAKRLGALFLAPDLLTYDLAAINPEFYEICLNTYRLQWEDNPTFAYGRQMGYSQGYMTEAAILTDSFDDMQGYVEQAAAFCHHHTDSKHIVPEGVIMHPSGAYWFRNCDQGNSVQQAEIVKCARLLIGLDDLNPQRGLTVIPRLPSKWSEISVERYPVAVQHGNSVTTAHITYRYNRTDGGYELNLRSSVDLPVLTLRMGPYPAATASVTVVGNSAPVTLRKINGHTFAYIKTSVKAGKTLEMRVSV